MFKLKQHKNMKTNVITTLVLTILFTTQAMAQEKRFGFELSGGASFATAKLNGTSLNPGLGFEGIFHYQFMPHTGIYGGWGWNKFGADDSFAGSDVCFEETGYVLGVQYKHTFGNSPVSYFLRAGGLYNHIEIENTEGDIIADSGHGLGWQLSGGVDVNLGKNWSLTPGVKFNALSRDIDLEGTTSNLDLRYLSVRVGILKRF
jgi:opacity protein-like surface antigen